MFSPVETGPSRRAVLKGAALIAALASQRLATAQAEGRAAVVLVTGSSRGFGRITAETMAREGFHVIASMRETAGRNKPIAEDLRSVAEASAWKLDVVDIDINSDASVESGVAEAAMLAGRIDVLVNNAGIIIPGPVELSLEAARQQFETNVFGQLRMLRAVAPLMRAQKSGLVVHVSSGLGRFVVPTNGVYCATKFAGEAMFEAARYELHPFGIETAIVQPGPSKTNFKPAGRAAYASMLSSLSSADQARASDYAEHLKITEMGMQDEEGVPPPAVAGAITGLAQAPSGSRAMRTPVMAPEYVEGLNTLNSTLEGIQQGMLQGSGMGHWLKVKT